MPSQQVLEEKSSEVDSIKDILKEHKSIGIASLQEGSRFPTSRTQEKHGWQSLPTSFKEHVDEDSY